MSIFKENFLKLQQFLEQEGLDGAYISSFDIYLNEYVPLNDCHRFYLSGFTGSVAELLVTKNEVRLYVDGRYHEQADIECDPSFVQVVKCDFNRPNLQALKEDITTLKITSLALESDRVSYSFSKELSNLCKVQSFNKGEISNCLTKNPIENMGEVNFRSVQFMGKTYQEKIENILRRKQAYFINEIDSISWLLNLEGFQLPFQSTIKAKCLCTLEDVYLFVPRDSKINPEVEKVFHFIRVNNENYASKFLEVLRSLSDCEEVILNDSTVTKLDYDIVVESGKNIVLSSGLVEFQSLKNDVEIKSFENSFEKSDKAIYEAICWLKENSAKSNISEIDYKNKVEENYKKLGARSQSFNTISGFGPNGSIIHYGNPKSDKFLEAGEMALLDSGAIFEEGFATDCTRTVIGYGQADEKSKEIYTLTLIGTLRVMNHRFKAGTLGSEIDAIAREEMKKFNYDYAHGTGHGVGINVHEGGFRLSPISDIPLVAGKVGSIEPGIYIPGLGGVRLENIAVVKEGRDGLLGFESFVYIGWDHQLINYDLMTNEDKKFLFEYERKCAEKGRSFLSESELRSKL